MTGMNNRETFLKTEPEMDITQFAKTELDLAYADESPNQILDIFLSGRRRRPISAGDRIPWWSFCGGTQEDTLH